MAVKLQIEARLRNPVPVIRQNLAAGLRELAPKLVARGRAEAPVLKDADPRRRPGALRDSIEAEVDESKLMILFSAGGKHGSDDVFYAHMVERGTATTDPNPFMRRSIRRERQTIAQTFERSARKPV